MCVIAFSETLGHPDVDGHRVLAFMTLVAGNLALILTNRSWSRSILSMFKEPNRALWWVLSGAVIGMGLIVSVPFLRDLFHFSILHLADLALCITTGIFGILWFEILKLLPRWRHNRSE